MGVMTKQYIIIIQWFVEIDIFTTFSILYNEYSILEWYKDTIIINNTILSIMMYSNCIKTLRDFQQLNLVKYEFP